MTIMVVDIDQAALQKAADVLTKRRAARTVILQQSAVKAAEFAMSMLWTSYSPVQNCRICPAKICSKKSNVYSRSLSATFYEMERKSS